jgi:hypothetical protein
VDESWHAAWNLATLMTKTLKRLGLALPLFLAVFAAGITSCGEADKFFDCESVCGRYKSCFDNTYDVGACRNRCKAKADADTTFQQKADACDACIDDKSCSEATFKCATQCAGVVPQ